MPVTNWILKQPKTQNVKAIKDTIKVPDFIAKILVNRGIDTVEKALNYAYPHKLNMNTPFLFKDMEKALDRILRAIENKEAILIFGDKDADGVCSTSILYKLLHKLDANIAYRVPERMENYGISRDVVAWAVHNQFSLMITVDCGITAREEVEYANSLGLDVIITDHHEPHDSLPAAYAIINPKLENDNYPFPYLSGGGTVYKLAQAMMEKLDLPEYFGHEIIFFDLETSGLNPISDEIIEIGAIKVKNGVVLDTYQKLIKPERPISAEITSLTHITNDMLNKEGIDAATALQGFVDFIGDRKLVGHNILGFDLPFVHYALKKHLDIKIDNPAEDTLKMARVMLKKVKDYKLNTVAQHLGYYVDPEVLHRSVDDSRLAAEVYRRLIISRSAKIIDIQKELLPLVAISTIADIMPLIGENRNIVKNGLKLMPYTSIGLITLIRGVNLALDDLHVKEVSWNVSPLINSPGRMGDASLSVELLISHHFKEAQELAQELMEKDRQRKELVQENVDKIISHLDVEKVSREKFVLIDDDNIPRGITGLLANKLATQLQIPAIVISSDVKGEMTGSVRVANDVNVVKMLEHLAHLFNQYGGHKAAGGFTIASENIDAFRQGLLHYMESYDAARFEQDIEIDLEIMDLDSINLSNLRYLENIMEPTGHQNTTPIFIIKNVNIISHRTIGKDQSHMLFTIESNKCEKPVIAWKMARQLIDLMKAYSRFDIVASPEINRYQNVDEARLMLIDIKGTKEI